MQPYNKTLKQASRDLRKNMTDAESLLWSRLRRKQILGVQFYRQEPLLKRRVLYISVFLFCSFFLKLVVVIS